jgi:hypothetical protein
MPLPLRCTAAVLSAVPILSLAGCGPDASDSGKASRTRASPTPASPSAGLPEGDSWRSARPGQAAGREPRAGLDGDEPDDEAILLRRDGSRWVKEAATAPPESPVSTSSPA